MQATPSLRQRATAWRQVLTGPTRFARHTGLAAAALALALVARQGTPWLRIGATAGELLLLGAALAGWWLDTRAGFDARRLVRQVIVRTDRALGERALRATRLVQRLAQETRGAGTNALVLATFHLDRVIEGASLERVRKSARRRARVFRWLGAVLALVVLLLGARRGREIIEGLDVLATRGTRAPWPMFWTDHLRIQAQPPAYLRAPARRLFSGATSMLPRGTQLTLRARPLYNNRQLVIAGGLREAPFVSDGEGGLVAHYTVEEDESLVVAARFGDVLIVEPEVLQVVALPDAAPNVMLEEAPATYQLRDLSRLELRWSAQDDHGLRQVDLVLRSGNREERRTLGSYDDESARQSGGHVLSPNDPFLRSLYLPALVSIEARDNDPVGGSKWGKSQAITIVPTAVGELDALRYLALVRSRDRFVDALAVAAGEPATVVPAEQRERFRARLDTAMSGFESALGASYGGVRVPAGLRSFALGRLRLLKAAQDVPAERARALEELILVLDGALASLSTRDAQRVARVLGNVAEEAMVGAQQALAGEAPERGLERLDKAIYALRAGAEQLLSLGSLGNDLGSVALADLGRVSRGRERGDLYHAELAAEHLAARLRRPAPSFGASSSGGVEAGQGKGSSEPSPGASQAEGAFDELAQRISELARQHAAALEQVDQALSESRTQPENAELRAEAERRADQIRDAVESLPEPGNSPGTAEASGALAREHARAMAHELDSLELERAAESAQRALGAIAEAGGDNAGPSRLQANLAEAKAVVEEQLRWVQGQLDALREAARERARASLQGPASHEEELAGTASELARRGDERQSPLPGEVTERLRLADQLMRQAARDLRSGEGESALSLQRQAQRLLENADQGKTDDPDQNDESQGSEQSDGKDAAFGGDVPAAEDQNRTEEFRRRVLKSLGESPSGRLAPAVKRYAEGLLR